VEERFNTQKAQGNFSLKNWIHRARRREKAARTRTSEGEDKGADPKTGQELKSWGIRELR
jgi:hypothetical protein